MHVWIVATYEPLPIVDENARLLRCGLLAEALVRAGHSVTWWTSTFHHVQKRNRFEQSTNVNVSESYQIRMLYGPPYKRNVSLARVRHNRAIAAAFESAVTAATDTPDVIFACVPTLELAERAVLQAKARGAPIVIDTRDKWPDLFLNAFPRWVRPLARQALFTEFRRARRIFSAATGLSAVSVSYLEWALRYAGRPRSERDGVFRLGYPPTTQGALEAAHRYAQKFRNDHGISPTTLVATYVGMFGRTADLTTVIEAARLLLSEEIRIVLVGDGDTAAGLRKRASGLPNIIFTGWLGNEETRGVLKASDLGLAAYGKAATQSLPNKPFEYMASGLPILSSLPGELANILAAESLGVTYSPGSVLELRDHLQWFAEHVDERRRMGARSEALFKAQLSATTIYPSLVRYLESIVEDNRRR